MTALSRQSISFSWTGVILAPLVVPAAMSALMVAANPGKGAVFGFVIFTALGGIVSYPTTWLLFLPCLWLMSKFMNIRWYWACLLGLILGAAVFFPVTWMEYRSSGPDSGPPVGTYLEFLWRSRTDAFTWIFPLAGLTTAAAYWIIGYVRSRAAIDTATVG